MKARHDQHFLIDPHAVNRIADLVDVRGKRVLEIGPGNGALTRALLDRGAIVHAIELDGLLCGQLADSFSQEIAEGRLKLQHGDATRCEIPPFQISVSNLPYSVSSKITFRLLETGFEVAVLMYQSEFAERMVAPAGTKDCGRSLDHGPDLCCGPAVLQAPAPLLLPETAGAFHGCADRPPRPDLLHCQPTPVCRCRAGTLLPPAQDGAQLPEGIGRQHALPHLG